jgi:hypothetical protein
MSEQTLYKNMMLLGSGIESCLEKKLTAPALILLYSGIDTAGWLDSPDRDATRDSFLKWVEHYLLKAMPFACTALELYAARCGLLHTMTPDSRLSFEGRARRICYAWGTARMEDVQQGIELTSSSGKYVAVHVNELFEAWRLGVLRFSNELEADPARRARVYAKAGRFFSYLGIDVLRGVLDILDRP